MRSSKFLSVFVAAVIVFMPLVSVTAAAENGVEESSAVLSEPAEITVSDKASGAVTALTVMSVVLPAVIIVSVVLIIIWIKKNSDQKNDSK